MDAVIALPPMPVEAGPPADAVMQAVSAPAGEVSADQDAAPAVPEPTPVETLYVSNLNEKITLKVMKQTLRNLFRQYGVVLDVVAHRNIRMRGQAFIAMTDRSAAARAVKEVKGFPLYGKPISIAFARTPSDAVVKRKTPALLDVHVQERKKTKSVYRKLVRIKSLTVVAIQESLGGRIRYGPSLQQQSMQPKSVSARLVYHL